MNVKKIIPSGRRLTFFLIITLVVAVFFIGYNFYFIPGNQNILQKNGFLILENISRNIKERNGYLETAFENILKPDSAFKVTDRTGYLQKRLNVYNTDGKIISNKKFEHLSDSIINTGNDSAVYLADILSDSLFYLPTNFKKVSAGIYVPAQSFIAPSISSQKKELFDSYLLLHNNSRLIYADETLGINTSIAADSLMADKKEALFAGVKEIQVRGNKYKMFYYPFKLGNEEVQLCGFLKDDIYYKKLHQVPVGFVYPIVIMLLLILIMMPLVKLYMMSKDEQISYPDFILTIISFFAGSAIITLIIVQVLLLMAADIRAKQNLETLSEQIENSFNAEINKSYRQLEQLDTLIKNHRLSLEFYEVNNSGKYDVSEIIKKYYQEHQDKDSLYYNFNRVSWINSDGEQIIKGQTETSKPVFTNVSSRSYFQVFHHSEGYTVPGKPEARFGFEPVNSLTNGDFSIIISKKDQQQKGWVTTISTPMYAVLKTIMPPGYGFCIADDDGRVLVHSETNRSLQENILENADPSRQIKESMISRQQLFFPDINLYGKSNALLIKPVAGMPLHLVTFYDKGYIVPVNMRILSFSLLFCGITFGISLLLWLGFQKRRKRFNINLAGPMHNLKWLVPKEKNLEFYVLGKFFLLANLVLQVIVIFSFKQLDISNYAVLILTLVMPVNIYTGLFVINYRVRKNMPEHDERHTSLPSKRITVIIVLQLFISLVVWTGSWIAHFPIQAAFIYFTVFFNVFLWLIFLLPAGTFNFLQRKSGNYLTQYALYATLMVLSLTAWPASLYTWYAHNQEITQSVKKEQLYLANALQQKANLNRPFYKSLQVLEPPAKYIDTLQLSKGIYRIFSDNIALGTDNIKDEDNDVTYEQFYFSIANEIGSSYYDPLLIPVLKDTASDHSWYWSMPKENKDKLVFWYKPYTHPAGADTKSITNNKSLSITSVFPSRYIFINASKGGLLLLVLVAGIVYGLYLLLRYISYRLFLIKFIRGTATDDAVQQNKITALFKEFKMFRESIGQPVLITADEVSKLKDEYDYYKLLPDSTAEYELEKTMFATLDKYKNFYDFTWNKFSSKEKYLLLNYAQNGFVNFKNTEVIHHLLELGIFVIRDEEIKIFSASFRAYILKQKNSEEILQLKTELRQESTWQTFRMPFLLIILGTALFIFITQEQAFQRITALLTGVTTVFTLLMKFFSDGTSFFSSKK